MLKRSKTQPTVTRDIRRIRALTQQVELPELDEPTRERLQRMALTARSRLEAGDLHGALSTMRDV